MKSRLFAIVLAVGVAFCGCGTIITATDGRLAPFSGTRAAAQGHGTQVDVPFSLVADVVLLPLTVPIAIVDAARGTDSNESPSKPDAKP